ncbi:MAG: RimK/LysX family protein [Rudaea sp.]
MQRGSMVIGWREWLALPQLGIATIKAKVDTGARTSALHVDSLQTEERDGITWLHFRVSSTGRKSARQFDCSAPAVARRRVTDSSGNASLRWFIRTTIELAGERFDAEINLTDRRNMLFPMLFGRLALGDRFVVDPSASYRCGRPRRPRSARTAP